MLFLGSIFLINLDDSMSSWGSGSSVLDLIFPQPETISEIRFKNWYTARLSILVRFDDSVQGPPKSTSLNWAAAAVSNFWKNSKEINTILIGTPFLRRLLALPD